MVGQPHKFFYPPRGAPRHSRDTPIATCKRGVAVRSLWTTTPPKKTGRVAVELFHTTRPVHSSDMSDSSPRGTRSPTP